MMVAGIDGCPAGWLAAWFSEESKLNIQLFPTLDAFNQMWGVQGNVWIDIPIGLPQKKFPKRTCDQDARKLLGKGLTSRVFSPPARVVLDAKNYREACRLNREILNCAISLQTWHIVPKIKEADSLFLKNKIVRELWREAHPEVCFAMLNQGTGIVASKKTANGLEERLRLIEQHYPKAISTHENALNEYRRKDVARDDIVDAMGLAVALRFCDQQASLPAAVEHDEHGLIKQIAYGIYANKL